MSRTRILMTAGTTGDVWPYALELAQALVPYNYEILLATLGKRLTPSQCRVINKIPHLTVSESSYKTEWMDSPWDDVDASGEWLIELAKEFKPDMVHLNTYCHGALPWTVPVVMVGHSCMLSWSQAVKKGKPTSWQTYQQRVSAGIHNVDLIIAPSKAMLDALTRHFGPLPHHQVIYNGCQPHRFVPGSKESFIISAGQLWDEAKNIQVLEQVALRLTWPILIAGDQQHPDGNPREFKYLHSLGELEPSELRQWLAKASIYVSPATYEPFGISILEAALSGCALVLGDIDSLREIWGDAALYVPTDDPLAIATTLGNLTYAPRVCEALGTKARLRAERYTSASMGEAYHHAYKRLAERTTIIEPSLYRRMPVLPRWQFTYKAHPTQPYSAR